MSDAVHHEVGGVAALGDRASSSPELSSPPSDTDNAPTPPRSSTKPSVKPNTTSNVEISGGANSSAADANATGGLHSGNNNVPAAATSVAKTGSNAQAPPKERKPRKPREKKEKDPNAVSERKPRKPRAKPDGGDAKPRKRQKLKDNAPEEECKVPAGPGASRQSKLTDLVSHNPPEGSINLDVPQFRLSQNGNREAIPKASTPNPVVAHPPTQPLQPQPQPPPQPQSVHQEQQPQSQPQPPARSSGQNYDPIRSATIEPVTQRPSFQYSPQVDTPNRLQNRASASPAISSIIHPLPSNVPLSVPSSPQVAQTSSADVAYPSLSPTKPLPASALSTAQAQVLSSAVEQTNHNAAGDSTTTAMEVDSDAQSMPKPPPPMKKSATGSSGSPSNAASPPAKPIRAKEQPPPLPQGSGLLSSSLFGGGAGGGAVDDSAQMKAPNIILHVPLKGESNKYVNFARLAEQQYGFAALYPRLAAQKARLARVAAASDALEKGGKTPGESTDEMSVDGSDVEGSNTDINMGGMGGLSNREDEKKSEAEGGAKTRKPRGRKAEEYNRDDPFIDDSELVWEEQAAASKDGFFVYSGPLVPEGEKPTIERYMLSPTHVPYPLHRISALTFLFLTELMAQSNAGEAVVEAEALAAAAQAEAEATLVQAGALERGQAHAAAARHENHASRRQSASRWRRRSWRGRRWPLWLRSRRGIRGDDVVTALINSLMLCVVAWTIAFCEKAKRRSRGPGPRLMG